MRSVGTALLLHLGGVPSLNVDVHLGGVPIGPTQKQRRMPHKKCLGASRALVLGTGFSDVDWVRHFFVRSLGIALPRSFGACPGSFPDSVLSWFRACMSLLACTSLSVRGCAQQRQPSPFLTWIFTLSMAVPPCLHMLVCGGSLDIVRILALVVVQLVILATHFLACSVMLLKGIWPTACLRVLLSRTSVSNGAVGFLFLWMLLLGIATFGCSTQAPLTTLLPLLSGTSHLLGKCVNDFCQSAAPCQGLSSNLLWVSFRCGSSLRLL